MDWEILDNSKENKITQQIEQVVQTINKTQNKLLAELHPVLLDEEVFMDSANWWYVKGEGLYARSKDDGIQFHNTQDRANYASFRESNVAFTRMPNHPINVLPEQSLLVHFETAESDSTSVKIAIVEYSGQAKTATTMIDVNKETQITLRTDSKYIRIALKIARKGKFHLKRMSIKRIFAESKKPVQQFVPQDPFKHVKDFKELKVACIFDEFTMSSYKEEVELITFTPENWQAVLEENPPHFLFVESAWHGNFGTWQYQVGSYSNTSREALFDLLEWCKDRGIPTVFWNKEDPIHFDKFIDSAKRFDYIYTTDANKIPDYQKRAKHKNVYALPFAAEPKHHNPIQLEEKRAQGVCFAGSYYANRHQERREVMDQLLEISDEFGLVIYDRNYERAEPEFRFPKQFEKNVVGSLPYNEIEKAYKGYRFMLNVNSVIHSPTMFSRRVFEGLASGTPILSSYSEGIERIFGNLVIIAQYPEDLRTQMKAISEDEHKYRKLSLAGIREVYEKHTYKHRLNFMLANMGISLPVKQKEVNVISIVESEEALHEAIKAFRKQSYQAKKLSLFIRHVADFNDFNTILNTYQDETISIYLLDYLSNYQKLDEIISSEYITFLGSHHFYGRHYLKDLMIAAVYTDADFIGKGNYVALQGEKYWDIKEADEYTFTSKLSSIQAVLKTNYPFRKDLKTLITHFMAGADLSNYMKQGAKMFSTDKYNFIHNGKSADEQWIRRVEI